MAISYATLFARLGKAWYSVDLVNEFCGAAGSAAIATDLPTEWEDFVEQFDSANATIRGIVSDGPLQLAGAQEGLATYKQWVATAMANTILEMADADNPLTERTIEAGVAELVRQMLVDGQTIDSNTISAAVSYGSSNEGDGVLLTKMTDGRGRRLEYSYAEDLELAFTSTGTVGSEQASVRGEASASGLLSHTWPLGSGGSINLSSVDTSDNLLTNSDFEDFTVANTPDDWTIGVGTVGVHIFSIATPYTGTTALKFTSDGATAAMISQAITGLESETNYALNCMVRASSATAAGSTILQLVDADTDLPLDDEAGTLAKLTIANSALTTSYANFSLCFSLREPLPANIEARIEITASTTSTRSIYIDHVALQLMSQAYRGGPYLALFCGATAWAAHDTISVAVANDYGGTVQTALWRALDLPSLELVIPSDAASGETIADSVIS